MKTSSFYIDECDNVNSFLPEKRLIRVILTQAADDYFSENIELKTHTKNWFYDSDADYIFSFLSICNILGIDPLKFQKLLNVKLQQIEAGEIKLRKSRI